MVLSIQVTAGLSTSQKYHQLSSLPALVTMSGSVTPVATSLATAIPSMTPARTGNNSGISVTMRWECSIPQLSLSTFKKRLASKRSRILDTLRAPHNYLPPFLRNQSTLKIKFLCLSLSAQSPKCLTQVLLFCLTCPAITSPSLRPWICFTSTSSSMPTGSPTVLVKKSVACTLSFAPTCCNSRTTQTQI